MENAQRDIHVNFAMKRWRMKMVIPSIDNDDSLMEKNAKSNAKVYGSIIGGSFHTVPFFPNVLMLILMLKFARSVPGDNNKSTRHGGDLSYTRIDSSYPSKYSDVVQCRYENSPTSTPDTTPSSRNCGVIATLSRQALC